MADWIDALERLTRLHREGALTDAEFAEQKARLLAPQAGGGQTHANGAGHELAPANTGFSPAWVLAALAGAVLLGVLLWWQLVDSRGVVTPVAVAGAKGEASATATPTATTVPATVAAGIAVPAIAVPATVPSSPSQTFPSPQEAKARAFSPSFECDREPDRVLAMICGSRELSRKDRILSDRFKAVLNRLDQAEKQALLRRQREFLRERAACEDTYCLNDWYDRVNEFYL